MPIINPAPVIPSPPKLDPIRIAARTYRGVTVDTRYQPKTSLITQIEGARLTVNYYSQVLNVDNNVDGQSLDRAPAWQQYRLIKQLELRVQTDFTFDQDSSTKNVKYSGQAISYPFLIPNIGDMFLADVGDGREAVFMVTESVRKSMYQETCYEISYESVDWSTDERRKDLDNKVVETYQFVRDFYLSGQNPLVTDSDYAQLLDLTQAYSEIIQTWAGEFYSNEFSTWMIPGQSTWCYDSFLVGAITQCYSTDEFPQLRNVRARVVDGDDQMKIPTIWDVLITRNLQTARVINEQMGLQSVNLFSPDGMMESIRYSGIRWVVYPKNPRLSWDQTHPPTIQYPGPVGNPPTMTLVEVAPRKSRLSDYIPTPELNGLPYDGLPLIKQILVDDYYIFSEAFYSKDKANQSRLEALVWDYLLGNDLDQKLITALINSYQSWGALERFYYTPVLLILVKATVRSI